MIECRVGGRLYPAIFMFGVSSMMKPYTHIRYILTHHTHIHIHTTHTHIYIFTPDQSLLLHYAVALCSHDDRMTRLCVCVRLPLSPACAQHTLTSPPAVRARGALPHGDGGGGGGGEVLHELVLRPGNNQSLCDVSAFIQSSSTRHSVIQSIRSFSPL